MISREMTVSNKSGLQSKSAAVFIQKASGFKSRIWVEKDDRKANAKSLLGLLSLGIENGTKIMVIAEGEDELEAIEEISCYIKVGAEEV